MKRFAIVCLTALFAARQVCGLVLVVALCAAPAVAVAQAGGAGGGDEAEEQSAPPSPATEAPPAAQGGGNPVQGFQVLPTVVNTYIVTRDLRGLQCVVNVGGDNGCAVANSNTDEGGYPWTLVKCRGKDQSVSTFAWSLTNNRAVSIFEAPPSLVSSATTYGINVRLGRVCMQADKIGAATR